MIIKLIQPRMRRRPMDTDIKLRMAPPLGLLTVAAVLRGKHTILLENENIRPLCTDDTPDIVGITVTVDTMPRAAEIAREYRRRGIPVVAGGIHITTAAHTVPPDTFDVLCIGAAEGTWPQIMDDLKAGTLQPVYRCTSLRGEQIVSPAYDMLHPEDYLYVNIVHTSRGCPFRCDFCYNSAGTRSYIRRPIPDVLRDVEAVNCRHVMFIDDNFAGDPDWTRQLCLALKPLNIRWNAAVSVNIARHPDLLDLMKESGCRSLFIGFESVSPDSVKSVHKVQNEPAFYSEAVRIIHSRGIMIHASFVFGLDSDTKETFDSTLRWIVQNRIETVTSHILTPYPGTVLYDRMRQEGRLLTEDLSLYNTANVVFIPAAMTPEELQAGYENIYRRIYSFPNILRRIPRSADQIPAYLMFNLFYRKFGRFTDWLCRRITYERIGRLGEKLSRYL